MLNWQKPKCTCLIIVWLKENNKHWTKIGIKVYWGKNKSKAKKKNMCVYDHPTDPIFQPPTLTFFIGYYSTLIFASDPINFYTEFG